MPTQSSFDTLNLCVELKQRRADFEEDPISKEKYIMYENFCDRLIASKRIEPLDFNRQYIDLESRSTAITTIATVLHYFMYGLLIALATLYQLQIEIVITDILSNWYGEIVPMYAIILSETIVFFLIVYMISFIKARIEKKREQFEYTKEMIDFLREQSALIQIDKEEKEDDDITEASEKMKVIEIVSPIEKEIADEIPELPAIIPKKSTVSIADQSLS